jgi:hypothetical protein
MMRSITLGALALSVLVGGAQAQASGPIKIVSSMIKAESTLISLALAPAPLRESRQHVSRSRDADCGFFIVQRVPLRRPQGRRAS